MYNVLCTVEIKFYYFSTFILAPCGPSHCMSGKLMWYARQRCRTPVTLNQIHVGYTVDHNTPILFGRIVLVYAFPGDIMFSHIKYCCFVLYFVMLWFFILCTVMPSGIILHRIVIFHVLSFHVMLWQVIAYYVNRHIHAFAQWILFLESHADILGYNLIHLPNIRFCLFNSNSRPMCTWLSADSPLYLCDYVSSFWPLFLPNVSPIGRHVAGPNWQAPGQSGGQWPVVSCGHRGSDVSREF